MSNNCCLFYTQITANGNLESIRGQFDAPPRYWSRLNPPYKVDFLVQKDNEVYPVEVKSESSIQSQSLKKFKELFPEEVKLRVHFSMNNLKLDDDDLLNIPLYLADCTANLIKLALKEMKTRESAICQTARKDYFDTASQ